MIWPLLGLSPLRWSLARSRDASGLLLCLPLFFVIACGGAQSASRLSQPEPAPQQHVEPTGLRVLTLPRATPNVLRLSLWVDAGTRDADPPQLATVSAWAAARAHQDVHARVLPDATEFWIEVASDQLDAGVQQLANTLAARSVDAATITTLRAQLTRARAAHELDARNVAERNALIAALGETTARTLMPFGVTTNDEAITSERVAAFMADHFGPNRALLVGAGDTRGQAFRDAVSERFSSVVRARAARGDRGLSIEANASPSVGVDAAADGAVAVAFAGVDDAEARALSTAVVRRWHAMASMARWLPLRGGAIATVVASTSATDRAQPMRAIEQAADALAYLNDTDSPSLTQLDEDLASLTERAGLAFASARETADPHQHTLQVGYGIALPDKPRAGPNEEQRVQTLLDATREQAQRVIAHAAQEPAFRGEVGTQAARLVLGNGARVSIQRRNSDNVAISVRFAGGAREEHRGDHGRTALLALLSAQACEGIGPGALANQLRELGATLSPTLEADSFGLQLSAPKEHWRASFELASRCAITPLLSRRGLRDAQARMLTTLAETAARGKAAIVAEHLAATHPGTIAPWGDARSALLDLDAVVRAHAAAAVGARVAVAVVGDVDVAAVVRFIARRFAGLPPGNIGTTSAVREATPSTGRVDALPDVPGDNASPRAVLMFHVDGAQTDAVGARSFVALLGEALSQLPLVGVTWFDANAWADGAWAAIEIELPLETLEQLNARVAATLSSMNTPPNRARARELIERGTRQQTRMLSESVHEATEQTRRDLLGAQSTANVERANRTFDHLLRSTPSYLVSRGR